jgi:hypothetical protein
MKVKAWFFLMAVCVWGGARAQLPDVAEAAVSELGSTYGTPQMNGFVFIDGHYVPQPYTVTRRGNGIFINRIQVEQPVAWPRGGGAEAAGAGQERKKTLDADGDFEVVAPVAQARPEPVPEKAKAVKSIDDLFADGEEAAPPPEPEPEAEPAVPPPVAAAAVAPPAPVRSPEKIAREKAWAVEGLDRIRKNYEQSLERGEFFFFGQRHNRVNGTYGTARTLMGVLPKALRYASSPQDLQQRLQQGGVYFIDLAVCVELFRNKMTFPQLEERLRKIEEGEALDALKRKSGRG